MRIGFMVLFVEPKAPVAFFLWHIVALNLPSSPSTSLNLYQMDPMSSFKGSDFKVNGVIFSSVGTYMHCLCCELVIDRRHPIRKQWWCFALVVVLLVVWFL